MQIRLASSDFDWDQIKKLFREYFEWIRNEQGIDLRFQGVEEELKSLPGAFAFPQGCMLLAEINGLAGGCVGLRPLDAQTCEMKRMYVKPDFRGKGIGRLLGEQIIQQAKKRGYQSMRLDTADTMHAAQGLYRSLGFKQIHQYYNLPVDVLQRAVFMELAIESEEA